MNINGGSEQEYAIKINFNTVSRELIYAEMAFLLLVKNRENLPKLVNLFVHHDITHIVLEYFKFKPFIVPLPLARPSSTPSPSRRSSTTSSSCSSASRTSRTSAFTTATSSPGTSSTTPTPSAA